MHSTLNSASHDGTVRVWKDDGRGGYTLSHVILCGSPAWTCAFPLDGSLLVVGFGNGTVIFSLPQIL